MNFDDLRHAGFSLLDDAVTDWSTMVRNLKDLEKDANDGLLKDSRKANWKGESSTVNREFVGKTAGEFGDAHKQAESIRNILRDTRDELKDFKKKLDDAVDRALQKKVTVKGTSGGGFQAQMNADPEPSDAKATVDAIVAEIQGILEKATESDDSAAKVLRALADLSKHGFSDAAYKDRDSAANALKEAERLAALAKKNPEDLTVKDFDALNKGLKEHGGDPLFAEHFAEKLGPEGTLELWAGINDPRLSYELRDRIDKFDDLQKNLSLTLAAATQADTPEMLDWTYKMTQLGSQPVGQHGPLGFQVMSNLMRWGDYDDAFLTRYGDALIDTEKKLTENGRHGATMWQQMGIDPLLNRTGSDSGGDPFTGFMKALSNSPDAATEFFNADFVTSDEDHEFYEDKDNDGNRERRHLSNFDYLFEEREWPSDRNAKGDESITGQNSLALALEAATTGHPAGEYPTADTPPHSAEQAKLMSALVSSISDDPERLTGRGYMSDSIGQITAEYLPDINRAMSDDPDADNPKSDYNRLYPLAGSQAEMGHKDASRLLFTLGQNPEGYAAVEYGQKGYMASLMDYHLNPDLPSDMRYAQENEQTLREISYRTGEISGTLTEGRMEEIRAEGAEKDKEYGYAMSQTKGIISGVVGTGVGVGTSFIASPAVGAGVGGAAGTMTSVFLEEMFKDAEGTAAKEAGLKAAERWEAGMDATLKHTQRAVDLAAAAHGIDTGDLDNAANDGARLGFEDAGSATDGTSGADKTDN